MKSKFFRYLFNCALGIILVTIFLGLVLLKPLDNSPYFKSPFFQKTIESIDENKAYDANRSSDTIEAGWSKVSIVPPFKTPIAIDANRKGKMYDGVHDTVCVRTFVFKQGDKKIAYVSADLLIIPPTVTSILDTLMRRKGYDLNNIYLTATHTHCSIGGWHDSFVGEIFAGNFDIRVPIFIAKSIESSILQAEQNVEKVKVGYIQVKTHKLVYNRLVETGGEVDSSMRIIKFEKQSGQKACLITFTAHATCLHDRVMQLSGDWPGMMINKLDSSKICDFACFSAGSVGSHGPFKCKKDKWQELAYISNGTTAVVYKNLSNIKTNYVTNLNMVHQPIVLRQPNFRINSFLVLRPHWFVKFFGKQNTYINMLQIGNIVFAGMPCDFSGEMDEELDEQAKNEQKQLLVTSFNGCFIGYITDDRRYDLNTYETRTMNWYGPGNGSYFTELIMRMMAKMR